MIVSISYYNNFVKNNTNLFTYLKYSCNQHISCLYANRTSYHNIFIYKRRKIFLVNKNNIKSYMQVHRYINVFLFRMRLSDRHDEKPIV